MAISMEQKASSGQCESSKRVGEDGNPEYVRCTKQGIRRHDNGLDSGIHCQDCWESLLYECRQRSW